MSRFVIPAISLALVACGPEPTEPADPNEAVTDEQPASPSPANDEEDIRHFLLQQYPDAAPMRYALAWHDLNGDGSDEAIVHVVSSYLCGSGGCNTLVLSPAGPMWETIAEISVSRTPIGVLEASTNGWKDITVAVSGGGGPSGSMVLRFDGEGYPSNPTVAPAEPTDDSGTVLIAEEPEFTSLEAKEPTAD